MRPIAAHRPPRLPGGAPRIRRDRPPFLCAPSRADAAGLLRGLELGPVRHRAAPRPDLRPCRAACLPSVAEPAVHGPVPVLVPAAVPAAHPTSGLAVLSRRPAPVDRGDLPG